MVSFFSLAALSLLPAVIAQNLMVNTPTGVVECEPVQLTWVGSSGPYFLSLIPAGQSSAMPIKQFPTQTGNAFTWTADLASGSSFTVALKDSKGAQAFSDIVTVQSGPNSSCINTSVTETGGTGGTAAPTSGGSSVSSPAATTSAGSSAGSSVKSSAAPASGTASATGSAASSSSTSKPNGAPSNRGSALAVAGVMGLVGAALF